MTRHSPYAARARCRCARDGSRTRPFPSRQRRSLVADAPSSGPSGHLLPEGRRDRQPRRQPLLPAGEKVAAKRPDEGAAWLRTLKLAVRFSLREMRGGLSGFLIFLACIALGVAAIGGVNSVAQ